MGKSTRPGSTLALDRNGDLIGAGKFLYMMDEHREMNCDMDFAHTKCLEGKSSRIGFPKHLTFVSILLDPKTLNDTY